MIIREPLVSATYFYLREAPGDNPVRRRDRHDAFVEDAYQMLQSISGWLSIQPPALPVLARWENDPPPTPYVLLETGELQGRINASAWLSMAVLRNTLLLSVKVARAGDHEQTVWAMLDEALGEPPTTPSWMHTSRYWCGIAPRPPEDLEVGRSLPIRTPFGVLCLGQASLPHLLLYPDARTETRANSFLNSMANQLDWYMVQARFRREQYESHASSSVRTEQRALEQVMQSVQSWAAPDDLRSMTRLSGELARLESAYDTVLADLAQTQAAAQDMRALGTEYRQTLMEHGLWDAAPTIWEARISSLTMVHDQIESDLRYIDTMLRRMELLIQTLQTRIALQQSERQRLLLYLIAGLGAALLIVLIVDSDPAAVLVRLVALAVAGGLFWVAWQRGLRSRLL